ncbi:MAG TPA: ABC transporter ATP-binding protein [Nitrososphaeraceae archaeon]|nr:ABC transporter ATP-binding protein [Nitrososphaeraceae archaeon]
MNKIKNSYPIFNNNLNKDITTNEQIHNKIKEDIYNINNNNNNNNNQSNENASNVILRIEDVSKVFFTSAGPYTALKKINFTINKGEFVSIIGPSGSGKSTLLNILGALDKPTSGKVFINNIDLFSANESELAYLRNNLIGFIFQSYNLIYRTTVIKNVEMSGLINGMNSKERKKRALILLDLLGIKDKAFNKTFNLSGGQQQRVAIARALFNNPFIILADEPTGNLDTKTGNEVFNLLQKLSSHFKRTIIMVTHNHELAGKTDKMIFLKDGMIEKEIFNNN